MVITAIAGLGVVSGVAIGCVGIGGVIVVPALVELGGFPVRTAISVAIAGYILTGLIGTLAYVRNGTLVWRDARMLCLGAIPTAVAGTLAATVVSPTVLEIGIGVLTLSSGLTTLFDIRSIGHKQRNSQPSGVLELGLGGVTGFFSALTGTGGPAVLIPLLLWMDVPALSAVASAQAIQLPIAGLATLTNVVHGQLDVPLSLCLGAGLSAGVWAGARVAQSLNPVLLRRVIAVVLLVVGHVILGHALLKANLIV